MATSAIGPGFLTQTALFTQKIGADFAFVVVISIVVDFCAQLNIWRIICAAELRAQDAVNMVLPGLGYFLSALVVIGGFAFNIGNVAGAGLGMNVLFGISPKFGALIGSIAVLAIFTFRRANRIMDRFVLIAGFAMIGLTLYVVFASDPPIATAALHAVRPDTFNAFAILTLVGGTVGGYITFAGAHRLLDAGVQGRNGVSEATHSATLAITAASVMRILLFLAAFGIVAQGLSLAHQNPPASVFRQAAGEFGYKLFGIVLLSAAMTSIIGAAYTSVSFIRTFWQWCDRHYRHAMGIFIFLSMAIFLWIGRPVKVLVWVGALNGLILPISLGPMLLATRLRRIVGEYRHPVWLTVGGWLVCGLMAAMSIYGMVQAV
jgi:Mn2+/Fe2+ NRAMP family transporter